MKSHGQNEFIYGSYVVSEKGREMIVAFDEEKVFVELWIDFDMTRRDLFELRDDPSELK